MALDRITTIDRTKTLANYRRSLDRRQLALKATLDEIALLERSQDQFSTPEAKHSYNIAMAQLMTKRDRQSNAVAATEAFIIAFDKKAK